MVPGWLVASCRRSGALDVTANDRYFQAMIPAVQKRHAEIAQLCGRYGVRRLEVFGSASVEVDDAAARDIDLIVDFDRGSRERPLPCYFEFKHDMESLLGKPVDLVELDAMPDSRLRRSIVRSAVPVYAAATA
jgi:predicted nucleotidyltransferase